MPGPPDLPHAALSELLFQQVAPQLARTLDFGAQVVDHPCPHIGHGYYEEVREHEPEEEL